MRTLWRYSILGLFILINLTLVVHWNTGDTLPTLGDEFIHIGFARQLVEEGMLPFTNPYLLSEVPHRNFESGFHFLLAGIYALVGTDLIYGYQLLVATAFIINSLLFYLLVRLWRDHATALLSTFFFGTITTTGGMLAHDYFLPLTVGMTLLLLLFILWHWWSIAGHARSLWYLVGVALLALITYPPALLFFGGVITFHLLSREHTLAERFALSQKSFFTRALIGITIGWAAVIIVGIFLGGQDLIFFTREWEILHIAFSPLLYLGTAAMTTFGVGLYVLLFRESYTAQILVYWVLFSVLFLYINYVFDVGILIPFPRLFLFYLIGFSAVAGIGMIHILRSIRLSRIPFRKTLSITVLVLLVGMQYFHAKAENGADPPLISDSQIALLNTYVTSAPPTAGVIADGNTSFAIYPTTGKHVAGVLNANIGGGDPGSAAEVLTAPSCTEKKVALHRLTAARTAPLTHADPIFIMSTHRLSCTYLQPVASSTTRLYTLTKPFPRFTKAERDALIPTPPEDAADPPSIAITDPDALHALISGNTISGDDWTERYHSDGHYSSTGSGDAYAGLWNITGPFYCFYDLIVERGGCVYISREGTDINSYGPDGTYLQSSVWSEGHEAY